MKRFKYIVVLSVVLVVTVLSTCGLTDLLVDADGDDQATDLVPPSAPAVSGPARTNDSTPTWIWTEVPDASLYRYGYAEETWILESTVLSFTPTSELPEGDHTLYVQARDNAGNWSAAGSYAIIVDLTTPYLLSSSPADGETWFPVRSEIALTFSEEIDDTTITSATIAVVDAFGHGVGGAASASPTVTFVPDASLLYNLPYTVTATTGITDMAGNAPSVEYRLSFRTSFRPFAAGTYHALAIDAGGNILGWGSDWYGELGVNTDTWGEVKDPGYVLGETGSGRLSNVVAVEGGESLSIALLEDGTVCAWGDNSYGQLGDGGTVGYSAVPVQVLGPGGVDYLGGIVAVAASSMNCYALKSDGTVWAWGEGSNYYGVGDGASTHRNTPVEVKTGAGATDVLNDVVAISGGYYHALALKTDGTVWGWGINWYGEVGNGTYVDQMYAVQVAGLTDVIAIDAGTYLSAAIRADGTLWTWGTNWEGELGINAAYATLSKSADPQQVVGPGGDGILDRVVSVDAGYNFVTACRADGTVWAWGFNRYGQLGNGTKGDDFDSLYPVQVVSEDGNGVLSGAVAVAATDYAGYAIMGDGAVYGWGFNDQYELAGDTTEMSGTRTVSSKPVRVGDLDLF